MHANVYIYMQIIYAYKSCMRAFDSFLLRSKYLGIELDEHLSLEVHINAICKKLD